jgi:hypothetical protein
MIAVTQCVWVITWSCDGLGCWQCSLFRFGFSVRFLFEQGDLAREDVEPLLLGLRDECALVDREFRVVDERVRQVVVLRSQVLFLLLGIAR